jgi:O-antigen/teichoic acid export membrane protein
MAMPSLIRAQIDRLRGGGLAAESAWGLVLELVTLVGTVLSFTLLGRSLGAAGYGGYASLYAIVGPLVTLAASGVVLALLQHVVRDGEPLAATARSCLSLSLAVGFPLTLIGSGVAALVVESLTGLAILSILLTEFVAAPLVQVAAGTVQAETGFIGAAKIRLLLVIGRIVLLVVLFVTDRLTVASFGVTMLVFSSVLGVASLRNVGRRYGFRFVPGRVRLRHLKTNALYSTAISASALNSDGDKLVLAANRLVVDTGLYAAAYRIVSFGLVPIGSVVNASHREFLVNEEGVRGQHLRRAMRFGIGSGAYGLAFGIILFFAAPLLPALIGEEFEGSVPMVRWLSPTVLMRAVGIFGLNGLMGLSRVGLRTTLIVANAVVAMAIYIVLVPRYGWEGAAIGTLISETIAVTSTWAALVLCQRQADRALDEPRSPSGGGA